MIKPFGRIFVFTYLHVYLYAVCKFIALLLQLLFGFYDHGRRLDRPGVAIINYIAFLSIRWKIEKVQFFCYREWRGKPDLEQSLIGEASFPPPYGINMVLLNNRPGTFNGNLSICNTSCYDRLG